MIFGKDKVTIFVWALRPDASVSGHDHRVWLVSERANRAATKNINCLSHGARLRALTMPRECTESNVGFDRDSERRIGRICGTLDAC
jgi:hypothetical protein